MSSLAPLDVIQAIDAPDAKDRQAAAGALADILDDANDLNSYWLAVRDGIRYCLKKNVWPEREETTGECGDYAQYSWDESILSGLVRKLISTYDTYVTCLDAYWAVGRAVIHIRHDIGME